MLAVACGCVTVAAPVGAGTSLYRYVDERGVVHFTNAPSDRRYARISVLRPLATSSSAKYISPVGTYDDLIRRASRRHGVPAALVKAVIHAESAFNPRAVSPKGAMGLMQLMPATAQLMGVAQPFHARQNVSTPARTSRVAPAICAHCTIATGAGPIPWPPTTRVHRPWITTAAFLPLPRRASM
jgi:hypothetical protein